MKIEPNYKRINKMKPDELQRYHDITKKSAHVHEDRSKFRKKKERQRKQKGWV